MSDNTPLRVAVIGGGLVGPLLAKLLVREGGSSVRVSLFERDAGPWTRDQGTALDLGADARRVLQRAGVADAVRAASRKGSDTMAIRDRDGHDVMVLEMPSWLTVLAGESLEVNRNGLRACLLEGLDAVVHWGHAVREVRPAGEQMEVVFDASAEQPVQTFDVVVGTDGSSSRIRRTLYDAEDDPFTGYACVQGFVLDPARECPVAHAFCGEGTTMTLGGGAVFFTQRYASDPRDARICFYLSLPVDNPQSLRQMIGSDDTAAIRAWLTQRVADWSPAVRDLCASADWFVLRNLYQYASRPVMKDGASQLPLVVCGDALHAMLPFQGAGANLGLVDAGVVATAIVRASATAPHNRRESLVRRLRAAEKVMLNCSAPEADASRAATVAYHATDAAVTARHDPEHYGGHFMRVLLWMRSVERRCACSSAPGSGVWVWPSLCATVTCAVLLWRKWK